MATEVQLKDAQGNVIIPKGGGGTPTSMQASQVTLASGTGLNSTNVQNAMKELNDKIEEGGGGGGVNLPAMMLLLAQKVRVVL